MMPDATTTVLDTALAFHDAGCSVIPVALDGTKRPNLAWKPYQTQRATRDHVHQWFATGHPGLGVITGNISQNLEMLELEGRAIAGNLLPSLTEKALENGLADLWRRVTTGYAEATPSGGVHFLYRVTGGTPGNTKLARRPATPDELAANPNDKIKVLVETRGEGGFVVVAPSHGTTHPTGKPWQRAVGDPTTIPTITADEHEALHNLARLVDDMPLPAPAGPPTTRATPKASTAGISPGDDYNARATWHDLLAGHGWEPISQHGKETRWRRPGKTAPGPSATTNHGDQGDWLWVFTTSTDFNADTTYTKFAAYTILAHDGDYSAAARKLSADGYGTPSPDRVRPAQATAQLGELAGHTDTPVEEKPPTTIPGNPQLQIYSRTDDGNALRVVDTYRDRIRYVPQRGSWLAWNGHRWTYDNAGAINELARTIARELPDEDKTDHAHRKWSLSSRGLSAMLNVARSDTRIVTPLQNLDARPLELNTPAGVVNLRTSHINKPDPAGLHTRSTDIAPDFDTTPRRWLKFLADTFAGDPTVTTYVQRLLGVSLVGQVLEQVLPFAYGEGANGKTTLLGTIQRLIGLGDTGYSISAPAELLLATNQNGHPTEIARLSGARLVVTSELDEGQRFAEAKVKLLTGRDTISGRFMRQDFFNFTPTHTLWLLGNHQPTVRAGGPAFWRRLRLVPFLHTVPADQRDPHLEDTLVNDEGPAILGWLIHGARDYFTSGLAEPQSVITATNDYARDQDTVARFVEERSETTTPDSLSHRSRVADIRAAYETWCRIEGETPVTSKALTLALRSRYGIEQDRDMHARYYCGIRLQNLSSEDPNPSSKPADEWSK
jgi:putative DNA primase/helicase